MIYFLSLSLISNAILAIFLYGCLITLRCEKAESAYYFRLYVEETKTNMRKVNLEIV